jgi:hypothetical protein
MLAKSHEWSNAKRARPQHWVLQQPHHAALPARVGQKIDDAFEQATAGVRDDQLHAADHSDGLECRRTISGRPANKPPRSTQQIEMGERLGQGKTTMLCHDGAGKDVCSDAICCDRPFGKSGNLCQPHFMMVTQLGQPRVEPAKGRTVRG